ncbi:MAG: hypothetical protein ACTIOK_03270 [Enterococcus malodoratus]
MKNQTYKVKEIEQEGENLRKQIQQTKLTKQRIKELKRQQLIRKQIDIDV